VKNVIHVGKEANEFELVQAGLVDVEENVLTTYERDLWEDLQLIVAKMSVEEIIQITGYSRRMAYMVMRGERKIAKANLLTRTYNQYDMNRRVKKASGVKVLKRMDEYD
jgi:U3 small nucleolar RNA-associated protein 14